ncbi:MAG: hypothetical protein ATN31_01595 [Candidatus Epulonipiscioides saccharophilum]|nr:MAG: hypothetical protein ATN31_01595 [Epulopiscium sp. AS2M-Bin001]
MADLIQVTSEELRERANEVRSQRTRNDEAIANIATLIRGLNEIWSGEAQVAFESKFHNMQGKFAEFSDHLERYSVMMDKSADELESKDKDLSSRINAFEI